MKYIVKLGLLLSLVMTFGSVSLNSQEYQMNQAQCQHYIDLTREEVDKFNLPLAKVYGQKAIQANPWSQAAWANYNDVVQRLADEGELPDFGTFIEESAAQEGPAASGESKFEGC